MQENTNYKSGFVSLIGRPNVGKSTLLNTIIGQKITIISEKAQTTRNKIQGIHTTDEEQIIFMDTPGIHKPKHKLGQFMVDSAVSTFNEVDIVLFLINVTEQMGPGDRFIMEKLQNLNTPIFLVLNQIDRIHPDKLIPIIHDYKQIVDFSEIIPVSAKEGNNVDRLMDVISSYLPYGPQFYPEDQVSDHPEYFIISELIREKVLELTREEVPHSVAVVPEKIYRNEDDKVQVDASIILERDSQKGIIIGKGGKMLKTIGTKARKDIERLLGDKIYLNIWVKVQNNWRDKQFYLDDFGYSEEDY